ncbi:hypothetical protein [Nakamurella sp.]|uniref:hypothetical protein n=1 Tax=Nakamurella sp. TaxID=1869182 RepID=UPI0037850285
MANGPDLEARVSALEAQMRQVAADAAAARHLAAANDRDLSSLSVQVDAHRAAINALGVQTAARFDRMDGRLDRMDDRFNKLESDINAGFTEMRGKLDQNAAGLQQIVTLLTDDGPVAQ